MEITFDSIITLITLIIGGGSLGGLLVWRYTKRKAAAEAEQAEAEAKTAEIDMAQKVQDTYQQILDDKQKEVEDNHRLIEELRQDRDHYKQDRNELREQLDKLQKDIRAWKEKSDMESDEMKRNIARLGRRVEVMFPLLCGRQNCPDRVSVTISDEGEVKPARRTCPKKKTASSSTDPSEGPINNSEL